MSQKAKCPACESYTSAIYAARGDGDPCPYCAADLGSSVDFAIMGLPELAKGMRLSLKIGGERRVVEIADIQEGERGSINLTVDTIPALYEGGWRFYGDPT